MKLKTFVFALVLLSFMGNASAQEKENKDLDAFVKSQVEIDVDQIKSSALEKVLNASFFKVKRTKLYENNGGFTETVLMKTGNGMQELYEPKEFIPSIKKDFKLDGDKASEDFQKVLNLLFDVMGSSKQEIVEQDNRWIFVQNEWFGEKQGYVVITDGEGMIIEIEKSDNIEL